MNLGKNKVTYIISDIDKALAFEWIAGRLDKQKFDLSFLLILERPSELERWLQSQKIECRCFYYTSKKNFLNIFFQVYRFLKEHKPDIVHCHLLHASFLGLTAAKLAGIRGRLYTRHHSDFHHRYFPKGIKWDKWCNRMATGVIAPSGAVREILTKLEKVPDEKIVVIHHGFDLLYFENVNWDKVNALKLKYGLEGKGPVVGVISRFTALKGIQFIIPAFKKLLREYPNALLLFFGGQGDYEKELNALLGEVPKENYYKVAFENDLSAVYPLFDVFVQVSIDRTIESFGQTYVEALASGIPSVFTLSGISTDFIKDRENALVVPYQDEDAIYHAVLELLTNKPLREKLSINGRESIKKHFALPVMIAKLEHLYERG